MNYNLSNSKEPMYIALYQYIKEDIVKGVYPYLKKLPSKRNFALETGASVITIEHALSLLEEEGYIEARERSGYFVIYKEADFIGSGNEMPLRESFKTNISAIQLSPGGFPFSTLAKAMRKVILDRTDHILSTSPNEGLSELKGEICAYLRRSRGINVSPEQIIVGSGAEYLYGLISQLFPDETFAIEDPSYEKIVQVYSAHGIKIEKLPLSLRGIDSDALKKTSAKVLHITPFNSYPTGITADATKRREYLNWRSQTGGIIIEDNYDSELTVSRKFEDTLFAMSKGEGVIYINTFSNTIAPSMRMGYMILPKSLLRAYEKRLGFYSCTVPVFEQYVLIELLRTGDFERHINRVRRRKRKELEK